MTKVFITTFLLVSLFIVLISLRQIVFLQCVTHKDNSKTHTHTQLTIIQDGKIIPIPQNIGIFDNCMHPLHTHDATGLIHMEYPITVPFYLGDFFDVMGTIFNDHQIGAIKISDGYKITVFKNGKIVKDMYRFILLLDLDKIKIRIDKSKN